MQGCVKFFKLNWISDVHIDENMWMSQTELFILFFNLTSHDSCSKLHIPYCNIVESQSRPQVLIPLVSKFNRFLPPSSIDPKCFFKIWIFLSVIVGMFNWFLPTQPKEILQAHPSLFSSSMTQFLTEALQSVLYLHPFFTLIQGLSQGTIHSANYIRPRGY